MTTSLYLSAGFGAGWQAFNNQGVVLAGGKLTTLVAGSVSTQIATYTDSTGATPNPNPIILDSSGRVPAGTEIWQASYVKFVLTDANNNPIGSWDNVPGVSNGADADTEWVISGLVPTYVSSTQFTVPGNQTGIFTVNRRVTYLVAGGTFYGYVSVVSYGTGTTTVTIVPDSTGLDASLYEVDYSLLGSTNLSVPQNVTQFQISEAPAKTTPVTADRIPLLDSAASLALKYLTWGNLIAGLSGITVGTATYASTAGTCTGNAATAGTATYAVAAGTCTGNAATAGTATYAVAAGTATSAGTNGTFTATGNGFSTPVTSPATWRLNNGVVNLYIPNGGITGVSTSTTFTISGLPVTIQPLSSHFCGVDFAHNNGTAITNAGASVSGSTVILSVGESAVGWSNTNVKSFDVTDLSWSMD